MGKSKSLSTNRAPYHFVYVHNSLSQTTMVASSIFCPDLCRISQLRMSSVFQHAEFHGFQKDTVA